MKQHSIVALSDFGEGGGAAALTGIVKRVEPRLQVYTLTNEAPRFDVAAASELLSDQLSAWPEGTVFVCAVDPGAGSGERVVAVYTADEYYIIAPDNGCLDDTIREHGIAGVRDLREMNEMYCALESGGPSHGRNLAYCAAQLACGARSFTAMGEAFPADGLTRLSE